MHAVKIRDLKKSYALGQTKIMALRGVHLDIEQGEFVGIIGASGSGKSTLLNLMACLDSADSGEILLQGENLLTMRERTRCEVRNQKIGFVFQSFHLIPVLSTYENVELPLLIHKKIPRREHAERVERMIAAVGLADHAHKRPETLSGGQRQRVAIARALVTDPSLVLADEPTANLDSHSTREIVDLMLKLNKDLGTTFLFSTHDEKLMSRLSRTFRLSDGVIV